VARILTGIRRAERAPPLQPEEEDRTNPVGTISSNGLKRGGVHKSLAGENAKLNLYLYLQFSREGIAELRGCPPGPRNPIQTALGCRGGKLTEIGILLTWRLGIENYRTRSGDVRPESSCID
jgi:hypothetical protein